jgi:hypothetical protein
MNLHPNLYWPWCSCSMVLCRYTKAFFSTSNFSQSNRDQSKAPFVFESGIFDTIASFVSSLATQRFHLSGSSFKNMWSVGLKLRRLRSVGTEAPTKKSGKSRNRRSARRRQETRPLAKCVNLLDRVWIPNSD